MVPVHGRLRDYADLAASAGLVFSASALIVTSIAAAVRRVQTWTRSAERRVRSSIRKAESVEKLIINLAIDHHWPTVPIDLGRKTANHLRELGLVEVSYMYANHPELIVPDDVRRICVANPKMLRLSDIEKKAAEAEIGRWSEAGLEEPFFHALATNNSRRREANKWAR
jgi:hypothetical protein